MNIRNMFAAIFSNSMIAVLAVSGATVGCNVESDEPTEQDYADVASNVGYLVANNGGGELDAIEDSVISAQGEIPRGLSRSSSGAIEGDRAGFRYRYAVDCRDIDGNQLAVCGDDTNEAAVVVDWSGEIAIGGFSGNVSRSGDWTVSGLQGDVAEFDGEGTFDVGWEIISIDGRRSRSFALSYAASYRDIRWSLVNGKVENGVIEYAIHAERSVMGTLADREAELDIRAVVTFDGSGFAQLELDGDHSFQIDLNSGDVTAR